MTSLQLTANKLLDELQLGQIKEQKRNKIFSKICDHFNQIVIVTFLDSLSERDFELLKQTLNAGSPDQSVEKIRQAAASIPGMSEKIEERLEEEYRIIKAFIAAKAHH